MSEHRVNMSKEDSDFFFRTVTHKAKDMPISNAILHVMRFYPSIVKGRSYSYLRAKYTRMYQEELLKEVKPKQSLWARFIEAIKSYLIGDF